MAVTISHGHAIEDMQEGEKKIWERHVTHLALNKLQHEL
jgi:hypothetical protein